MKRPLRISWLVSLGLALLCWGGVVLEAEAQKTGAGGSIDALYKRYDELYKQGKYEEAMSYAKELLMYARKVYGEKHEVYGQALNNLAGLYDRIGDYPNALPLYLEALENTELLLGKSHPTYGVILYNLADLYESMGNYEKALPLYLEVLKIEEKALSKPDSHFATRLHKLGMLYYKMGDYQKAKEIYEMAAKYIDEGNMGYAMSLNNLAIMYSTMGDYDRALSLYLASSENIENTLGKSHPSYGTALNNLATLYSNMGQYDRALPLLLEAIETTEKTLGKSHPDYSARLSNLAALYLNMGEYGKALPLYEEALEQTEKTLGKSHPEYGARLSSLADLYSSMGKYDNALPLLLEALEITEITLGKFHPEYGARLSNLAALYEAQRNFPQAIPLLRELWESAPRSDRAPPSSFALRLAHAYQATGQYPASDSLYAALLKTAAQGGDDYIQAHLGRGETSRVRGDFVQAAEHLDSALVALDQRPEPALRLQAYAEYAALYKAQNHWSKADSLYTLIQGLGFGAERLPEYATMLFEAAAVKMHMGQTEQAAKLQQKAGDYWTIPKQIVKIRERKNRALFFCTDQYKDSAWAPLKNAISDGEALAAVLHDKYGFDTLVHRNLGLDALIAEIKKTFYDDYQDDDHLFLFFAGHGYFDETVKMGGLVTHDTKKGKDASYFSYTLLEKYLADNHYCKHIFLVIDACFSGTFFESIAMRGDPLSQFRGGTPTDEDGFIQASIIVREGTRYTSRHVLTSSGKETVSDGSRYSPFAEQLLALLRTSETPVLTPANFEQAVQNLNPAPKLSTFKGHEVGGNFFLFHSQPTEAAQPASSKTH